MSASKKTVYLLTGKKRSGKDTAAQILQFYHGSESFALAHKLKLCVANFITALTHNQLSPTKDELNGLNGYDRESTYFYIMRPPAAIFRSISTTPPNSELDFATCCFMSCILLSFVFLSPLPLLVSFVLFPIYLVFRWGKPFVPVSMRALLQTFGTEGVRHADPDFWVRVLIPDILKSKVEVCAVTDVRFDNEVALIREELTKRGHDIKVVSIVRPGLASTDGHASENGLTRRTAIDHHIANGGTVGELREKVAALISS